MENMKNKYEFRFIARVLLLCSLGLALVSTLAALNSGSATAASAPDVTPVGTVVIISPTGTVTGTMTTGTPQTTGTVVGTTTTGTPQTTGTPGAPTGFEVS